MPDLNLFSKYEIYVQAKEKQIIANEMREALNIVSCEVREKDVLFCAPLFS